MFSLIKKEIREHVISRKGMWIFFAISILFSGLTYSFISVKELSLLAQVEVTMTFMKLLIGISILFSIILGSTMVSGEREQGTLGKSIIDTDIKGENYFCKGSWNFSVLVTHFLHFDPLPFTHLRMERTC